MKTPETKMGYKRMGQTAKWIVVVLGFLGLTLMAMQNCSQVEFAELQDDQMRKISEENAFVVGFQPVSLNDAYQDDATRASEAGSESSSDGFEESTLPPDDPTTESANVAESEGTTADSGSNAGGEPSGGSSVLACGQLEVQDIIIDIQSIEVKVSGGESYQLNIGSGPADLLDLARGIDFVPDRNMKMIEMRVMLGEENYVLISNNQTFPLKRQSQQNAGLLVKVEGREELVKDVIYHLTLMFEPRFHVKAGGGQCILHPNVRATVQ